MWGPSAEPLLWSSDKARKSAVSAVPDIRGAPAADSAPSQALFSGLLSSLAWPSAGLPPSSLDGVATVVTTVGISFKDGVETAAPTCVSYPAQDPKTRGEMWPGVTEEESSFWAGTATEEAVLPSTAGRGSTGSGTARRWCFKQPLGVDSAEAAAVLQ